MPSGRAGFIGIDAGTSGCKSIVLNDQGRVVFSAAQPYATHRGGEGAVTQDANDWLKAVTSTVRQCAQGAGGLRIAALGVTAPAHNAVLIGSDHEPLQPVILWSDARSDLIAAELRRSYGEGFFATTFVELSPSWTLPQLIWLRRKLGKEWGRLRYVLIGKDYLRFRMTGTIGTDLTDAAGTAMFDQRGKAWLESVCHDAGLVLEQMPPIRAATDIAGGLTPEWARRVGLPSGTPVSVGSTDTAAELISVGATRAGSALIKIASTGVVAAVSDVPHPHPKLLTYPHPTTDGWYTLAATSTAATAYRWLRDTLYSSPVAASRRHGAPGRGPDASLYAEMDSLASRVPAGSDGVIFLPFLEGERSPFWDRQLRAAFVGISSAHEKANLCRAVLEGVAFSLRSCRDLLVDLGLPIRQPYLGGGGVTSRLWREILVSTLGDTSYLVSPQGPAVGAALLAAAAVREAPCSNGAVSPAPSVHSVRPRTDWSRTYDRLYATYRTAADRLAEVSHSLVLGAGSR